MILKAIEMDLPYVRDNVQEALSEDDIKRVVEIVSPIFPLADGNKHTVTLYLGGYFSYHIDKVSAEAIANGIIKEVGNLF